MLALRTNPTQVPQAGIEPATFCIKHGTGASIVSFDWQSGDVECEPSTISFSVHHSPVQRRSSDEVVRPNFPGSGQVLRDIEMSYPPLSSSAHHSFYRSWIAGDPDQGTALSLGEGQAHASRL